MISVYESEDKPLSFVEADLSGIHIDSQDVIEAFRSLWIDLKLRAPLEERLVDVAHPDPAFVWSFVTARFEDVNSIYPLTVFPGKSCQLGGSAAHECADLYYIPLQLMQPAFPNELYEHLIAHEVVITLSPRH